MFSSLHWGDTNLAEYTANVELVAQAVTLLLILVSITLIGFAAQNRFGQRAFGSAGRLVTIIPLVRTIYTSVRRMANSVSDAENSYEQLVLVEFLPSSPNPASGRLVLVPAEDIYEVDMSVRRGMRLLMTTGVGAEDEDDEFPLPQAGDLPADGTGSAGTE